MGGARNIEALVHQDLGLGPADRLRTGDVVEIGIVGNIDKGQLDERRPRHRRFRGKRGGGRAKEDGEGQSCEHGQLRGVQGFCPSSRQSDDLSTAIFGGIGEATPRRKNVRRLLPPDSAGPPGSTSLSQSQAAAIFGEIGEGVLRVAQRRKGEAAVEMEFLACRA